MIIEPRDPLLVRDGRPFTNTPRARARTLLFPFPQTLAGALRGRWGILQGLSFPKDAHQVRSLGIRGPLLAEREELGWSLYAPSPLDALLVQGQLHWLRPLELGSIRTDLPEGLHPVGMPQIDARAKPELLPPFWRWDVFERWLLEPLRVFSQDLKGLNPLPIDVRTHVSINPKQQTAEEGRLFQTSGMAFSFFDQATRRYRRLGLALWSEVKVEGAFPLAGERRLAYWYSEGPEPPAPPPGLLEALQAQRAARIVLLTPGLFRDGFLPAERTFGGAPIRAVAVGRPAVVSGWDLERNRPKPTRRLAPAGSVYFVSLDGLDVEAWLRGIWMNNVADDPQDRLDGYGPAAIGTWSGQLEAPHAHSESNPPTT